MEVQKNIPYSPNQLPRLDDKGKNPAKQWVIVCYPYNLTTGKYERFRKPIRPTTQNRNNYDKRLREANKIKVELRRKMLNGWCKESNKTPAKGKEALNVQTLETAIVGYLKEKHNQPKMVCLTRAVKNNMARYTPQILQIPLQDLTKQDCLEFRSQMIDRVQAGSCNTYMKVFSTVLNHAIEKAWIASNPIDSVKQLKVTESNVHYPYTLEQRQVILQTALDMGYKQLYLLCQFVYYTLARPYEEIQNLKVGYIKQDTIFLPAQNAKNRKNSAVPIAPSLEAIIQEYKLRDYSAEYYIFGKEGVPSATVQGDIFYAQHRKILHKLELTNFDDRSYTLYGHKHSGAIDLAKKAKDAQHYRMVQFMCRHHSFSQTETYLRKWGFNMQEISRDFLL